MPLMSTFRDAADRVNIMAPQDDAPIVQHPLHALIAPIGPPAPEIPAGMSLPEEKPDLSQFASKPPKVQKSMSPEDSIEDHLNQKLMADYKKDADPYGSPDNHPGFFGKLLHGLSVATGGPGRREFEEEGGTTRSGHQVMGLEGRIENLDKLKSEQNLQGAQGQNQVAQAGHTNAETAEVAPNAESQRGLQGAQARNLNSESNVRENPPEEWKAIPSIIGPNGEPVEIEGRSGQVRFGGVQGTQQTKQPKPDTPEQQYLDEYQRLHKGSTVAEAERAYTNDTQKSPQSIMLVPGPNGGYTAQNVRPGSQVASGAISTGGLNTLSAGTHAADAALSYANDYLTSGNFSGPGDEALMEKYFELAKPSSGFRMTQNQMDMLMRSRSWMDSAEGVAYHAKTGQWFPPEQREQIVKTMNDLATSKGIQTPQPKAAQSGGAQPKIGNKKNGFTFDGIGWTK